MKKNFIEKNLSRELPFFLAIPAFVWQLLFFYIPMGLIVILSFIKRFEVPWWRSLSFDYYSTFFKIQFFKIIGRSFLLASVTALVCLLLAYPVAYFLALRVKRLRNLFLFFLILPFWTSLLVQVYAWFFVLERYGLINRLLLGFGIISKPLQLLNNSFSIYLVMIYCYLPFMVMPLYSILEKLDRQLLEASFDLGADGWQTFRRVTLPLSMPGIKTGFFLVFVPAFGEFVIPVLMGGDKKFFVGSLISHYFLAAQNQSLGAAFTCFSSVILIMCVFVFHMFFKQLMGVKR